MLFGLASGASAPFTHSGHSRNTPEVPIPLVLMLVLRESACGSVVE